MMKHKIHRQEQSDRRWTIPILENQKFISIDGLYDENDKLIDLEYTFSQSNNSVTVDFGFDSYAGSARYSYIEENHLEVNGANIAKLNGTVEDSIRILEKIKIYDKGVEKIGYRPVEASITYSEDEIEINFSRKFTGIVIIN